MVDNGADAVIERIGFEKRVQATPVRRPFASRDSG